ncbi:beta-glucosidase 22-like [Typha angustifolia]|uniref:beta-glucosidase 22-like n=1 Tax=Typha angustifolia TaxID=59011 RepID=UPI003C2D6C26
MLLLRYFLFLVDLALVFFFESSQTLHVNDPRGDQHPCKTEVFLVMLSQAAAALESCLLVLLVMLSQAAAALDLTRDDFPAEDFVFGAGTSAYQIEGAVAEDGRSPCIWDTFIHAGRMPDKSNGDVASDGYHKYKEDVKLMSDTNLEAYRFSISWSRLIPNGRGAVNPKGLAYYNNLINELVKHGIQVHITLYHLDLPQVLEDEYGGWLSPRIVGDFTAYADVCFREFGDRVSHWTTVVEPNVIGVAAYDSGGFPPNRYSYPFGVNCTVGNSTVEPYIAVHNYLLAHASAVRLYRQKYQAVQNGGVGINVYSFWSYPFSNSTADIKATKRALDFMIGWIIHPVVFGDYPEVMKKIAASRIPSFTKGQSELVKGAFDFIGINHYTSVYVSDNSNGQKAGLRDYNADILAITFRVTRDSPPAGQFVPVDLGSDPAGLQHMLEYFKDVYGNPPVYVQENGLAQYNDTLNDEERIDNLSGFMRIALQSFLNGVNLKGYFVWAFMDVFEFLAGYKQRYASKLSYFKWLAVWGLPGRMPEISKGDVASDGYHKYKEDVKLMSDTNLEAYRFSISWSRLIPNGRGAVNPKGLAYYNNLINELVKHGIQVHITLYHLDLPQVLEDEYGGWLSLRIVEDFTAYADVCFREFGDRVSHWTTVMEPNAVGGAAYDSGAFPPNRYSYPFGVNCTVGNSTVEPYIAVHNYLLAHASAVRLYRQKYQAVQNHFSPSMEMVRFK